jgi:hypothetical protein
MLKRITDVIYICMWHNTSDNSVQVREIGSGNYDTTLGDKFVIDLWQISGFLLVLQFPLPRYN